ncbi:MAG: DUF2817 domain-containing protein [Armatimonadetes bacterium]|nr:DUF2817 domain-containing protein [Armatimonadota bacterium]
MKHARLLQLTALALATATLPAPADIVADIVAHVPREPQSYADVMAALQELNLTERVECVSLGRSHLGRTVAMAVLSDADADPRALKKLMIIARQHGNEPSGTEATMALLRYMAGAEGSRERALLRRVALLVIPMANPDGAARMRRCNGRDVDLNRDWAALSQPETRAIEAAFLEWRPDVVMDLHELPAWSSKSAYQENFVETVGSSATLPAMLCDTTGRVSAQISVWMRRYGIPLNVYYDTPGDDLRLCHRHFGLYHQVPSYLFESKTGRGRALRDRAAYHVLGILVVANQLAYHSGPQQPQVASTPPQPQVRPTTVALGEPTPLGPDDKGVPRTLLTAQVQPGDEFCYLTFELNGRVVALTNQGPYEYALDTSRCAPGAQQVAVRCFDGSGRCLAQDTRTLVVSGQSASMGE